MVFKCGQIKLIRFRYFPLILFIMFGWENKGKRCVLKISTRSVLHFFWATKFFLITHLEEKNYFFKNHISIMKRLLALVSILKLKRMKAKPLKRHCIFPKRQKFVWSSRKRAWWVFKKDNDNGIQLFLHFSTQTWEPLRAQKYSLNEMKNLNRLLELIHSNRVGKGSAISKNKLAKRTYPMFNGHISVPMQSLLAFCFSSCGNTVLFWDERRIVLVKEYVLRFS